MSSRECWTAKQQEDEIMYDMFDYLEWRGDLPFRKVGPNPVDMLIFSTLSYIHFDGIVSENPNRMITLQEAANAFLSLPDKEQKVRVKKDIELLESAANTERFKNVGMAFYRDLFVPEEEKQFAALTYYIGDGTAVLAFRGTDRTLVGWKEDFNMTFQDSIPAQREALKYLETYALNRLEPIRLTGHSKGGNIAVYAASKADIEIQQRIVEIHNQDGPGFPESMMSDYGYLSIIPKISTFVPESSIVCLLMEHMEPHTIIKSKKIGLLQHDPYSWEVLRDNFIHKEHMSGGTRFLDQATSAWLATMTPKERNDLADVIYNIITSGGASRTEDLVQPKQIGNYVKSLVKDEAKRAMIISSVSTLIQAFLDTQRRDD